MSKRFAQVIILVEDKQQQSFVQRLLQELGYPNHKLDVLSLPAGAGAGEAYVRQQYPVQVKELRPRASYQYVALVLAIDGDGRTIADRCQQLAAQLDAAKLDARGATEKIVHLVPCRNIETWIEYLGDMTTTIDEQHRYAKLTGRQRHCQQAVEQMARLCRAEQPVPANCPPSLAAAIEELKRLGQALPQSIDLSAATCEVRVTNEIRSRNGLKLSRPHLPNPG